MSSSRNEVSRALAAWLTGPREPTVARRAPAPLVLFLCRSNATLSIMAEAILRHRAKERVRAASAGLSACARVDPHALECLRGHGIATAGLHSKGYDTLFRLYRLPVRILIALCEGEDAIANWNGDTIRPVTAYWSISDPGAVVGGEVDIRVAFEEAFGVLDVRILRFLALPLGQLNRPTLAQELQRIGKTA